MGKTVSSKKDISSEYQAPTPPVDYLEKLIAYRASADHLAGQEASNGKLVLPVFAPEGERSVQDQIDTGLKIDTSDNVITYGFFVGQHAVGIVNNPSQANGEGQGYAPFTAEQKAAAVKAVQLWDDLIAPTFKNVGDVTPSGWAHGDAEILFANTTTGPQQAWAYYPGNGNGAGGRISSDVWIADPKVQFDNGEFGFGQYGFTTLTHELGHTLGLSHPGNYNGSGATTYDAQAEYFQDSGQYTIMSYWSPSNTGAIMYDFQNTGGLLDLSAQTPLVHDIAIIQEKYGADLTTRATDTVYGFNSTAGNALYDFSQNVLPHLAIYDAGGIDTINLSGYGISQVVDLEEGAFSSIGSISKSYAQMGADIHTAYFNYTGVDLYTDLGYTPTLLANLAQNWVTGARLDSADANLADYGYADLYTIAHDNFAIAYGTIIENAIGGSARDLLMGNAVDNMLNGMGGNDVIDGRGGNDTLIGGAGNDLLIGGAGNDTLTGGTGNDTFLFDAPELGDMITDFGSTDMIDLSGLGDNLSYIGNSAFSGAAGEVRFDGGVLSADLNGGGGAEFMVTLQAGAMLNPDQLVLHA